MRTPERIHFETDFEYEQYCFKYEEYLLNEEWSRLNAREAVIGWIAVLFAISVICLSIYLYI